MTARAVIRLLSCVVLVGRGIIAWTHPALVYLCDPEDIALFCRIATPARRLDWITALRGPAIKALMPEGAIQPTLFDD